MKKFARVSLFVLVAMVLAFTIGCKNDSQSDPAPDPAPKAKFLGTWMSPDRFITCEIEAEGFTTTITGMEKPITGTWTVNGDTVKATGKVPDESGTETDQTFTMTMKAGESDVMDLPLDKEMGGNQVLVKKTTTKSDLTGTWKGADNAEGTIKITKNEEGKLSAELTINGGGSYNSSQITQDGNSFDIRWVENKPFEKTTGLVSASGKKAYLDDDSVFVKDDSQSDPAPDTDTDTDTDTDPKAKFNGEWRSTDGEVTCQIEAEGFTTTITGMEKPITGTWTVNGDTVKATGKVPDESGTETDQTFTMTMRAGESDVMDLPLGAMGGDKVLVKKIDTESVLTGTWKGEVLSMAGMYEGTAPDATIKIEGTKATLTVGEGESALLVEGTLVQKGNFFTVTWSETSDFKLGSTTGLVSASEKAYLDDGSVFEK